MSFRGSLKVDGGPRHMVIKKEGIFGWVSLAAAGDARDGPTVLY
jgi:hypothetical protein